MADIKWDAFPNGGDVLSTDLIVGLRGGANYQFSPAFSEDTLLSSKSSVNLATTANFNATYSGGGVGATLTAVSVGTLSIDGFPVTNGERILVKNQTNAVQNGIYVVTNSGSGPSLAILTRATDFDGSASGPVKSGDFVVVTIGNVNGQTAWVVISLGTITVGTSLIFFSELSAGTTGTVTSVGLTVPTGFNVTGSPVTGAGTLAVTTTWNINKPRTWTSLGNVPIPINFTNTTSNDLNFAISMLLQNTPGNSTTLNIFVGGILVAQIVSGAGAGGASTNLTMPTSGIIVPPGSTLTGSIVGEAQVSQPYLAYISM